MECEIHDNGDKIKRLKRIEGQVRGLQSMIEENRNCEDILVQISAANAAIHKVAQMVLEDHLGHCVAQSIESGDKDKAIENLTKAVEQYSRIK